MRRNLSHPLLLLLASTLTVLFSCSKSDDIDDPPTVQPYLTVQDKPSVFDPSGGSAFVTFGTNRAWRIEPELQNGDEGGWFEVAPLEGDAGEKITATLRIEPNERYTGRGFILRLYTVPEGTESIMEDRIEITQAKKNVILVGDNRREVGSGQQILTVEVQSNVDYTVSVKEGGEWITEVPESRAPEGLEEKTHRFEIAQNPDAQERTGVIVFTDKDSELSDELTLVQAAWEDPDPERTALTAFYEAAAGAGWTHSENWCGDKPLGEWYGVQTDSEGRVIALRLPDNNLAGKGLEQVGKLVHLQTVDLSFNALEEEITWQNLTTYEIESHLDNLMELETINLSHNRLSGENLPYKWSEAEHLQTVDFSSNRLTGDAIPYTWETRYENGQSIDVILNDNYLTTVNRVFVQHPQWSRIALQIIRQKTMAVGNEGIGGIDYEDVYVPDFTFTDLRNGAQRSMRDLYRANKLTMLLQWNPMLEESTRFAQTVVKRFHTLYGAQGFAVVAILPEGEQVRQAAERYLQTHDVAWPVVMDYADAEGKRVILPTEPYPSFLLVDQYGEVVEDMYAGKWISDPFWVSGNPPTTADLVNRPFEIIDMLNGKTIETFGYSSYQSTDFSMDKQYENLQTHSKGTGIDIVLLGEAFTDVDIETGFYKQVIEFAMESFFSLEPLKSYRDYFNVHMVYAVSRDAHIGSFGDGAKTALGITRVNDGTWFDAELSTLRTLPDYYKLPSSGLLPTVGVVINNVRGGIAYLNSYGIRPCFAFSGYTYGTRDEFRDSFIHETAGHAFGLLGDEYEKWYNRPEDEPNVGQITESYKRSLVNAQNKGWELNLSLSNDPTQVPWAHLIGQARFNYVGIFQGGYHFTQGVWRSEDQSVMRNHWGNTYFNAWSRELIVRRIMELSGEEYSFEKFLAKDSDDGRPGKKAASALRHSPHRTNYYHRPPILGE